MFTFNSRIFGATQSILATREASEARHDWFHMSDWYFCPDTEDRIVLAGFCWYNIDEWWRSLNTQYRDDPDFLESWGVLVMAFLEGFYFSPDYALEMHVGPHGVRESRTVRSLFMASLHEFHVPEAVVERDMARAREGNVVIDVREDDSDTISTISMAPSLLSEDITVFLDGIDYHHPIDLTFLD